MAAPDHAVSPNHRNWPLLTALALASLPLLIMYLYLFLDTVTDSAPGSLIPNRFTLEHWRLFEDIPGRANIWVVTVNTLIFSLVTMVIVLAVSSTAGYVLSRLDVPGRGFFLAGAMILHAFPSVTLIIAIFIVLQMLGLYNTLAGIILVKAALELPLGIWLMKGFYDTVPWEIEMAGVADGASRFTVWRRLVLPQVMPGIAALGLFAFLSGWSEYILPQVLAPSTDVQTLSVYLASLMNVDSYFDMSLFKAVGVFYMVPVLVLFVLFQRHLMNIYAGGTKG